MNVPALLIGVVVGIVLWYLFMRPWQLNEHERERRELGLPSKRELPEDRK